MVTQVLIATTSFSLGILAFCGGLWLTIWHINQSNAKEVRASLIAGYFIVVMSIASLAITSTNLVNALMFPESNQKYSMDKMDKKPPMGMGSDKPNKQ